MAVSTFFQRWRSAAWLGWQVESNWADPALFTLYIVARPLAVAAMLVAMYWAVRGRAVHEAAFAGFYVANAFHAYANTVLVGMGWVVFEEREEFETLKYVYTSPIGMFTYLFGRSTVRFTLATISTTLTLLMGWFVLHIRWDWALVRWAPLLLTLAIGGVAIVFSGLLLAGLCMVMTRAAVTTLEGITLGLYLLCGVIFPVDLLPLPLQWVAYALPFTWWYEAIRRFLLGAGASQKLAALSDTQLLGAFALVTLVTVFVSRFGYERLEHRARALGRLDQTTLY
jgi:ABC-2 type transport system permease protein